MEETNQNSILYYSSICDCLNTFFRIDKDDKRLLNSIKKKLTQNYYTYGDYTIDFKKLIKMKSKYSNFQDIFELIENLEEYFNMLNIMNQIC